MGCVRRRRWTSVRRYKEWAVTRVCGSGAGRERSLETSLGFVALLEEPGLQSDVVAMLCLAECAAGVAAPERPPSRRLSLPVSQMRKPSQRPSTISVWKYASVSPRKKMAALAVVQELRRAAARADHRSLRVPAYSFAPRGAG